MKKILSLFFIGVLSIGLLAGCSEKKQEEKDKALFFQENAANDRSVNYGENNFIIRDIMKKETYVFDKDCNLIETIQGRYINQVMSPNGKECMFLDAISPSIKHKMYKKKIGKDYEQTLYWEAKEAPQSVPYLIKWTDDGIYYFNNNDYGKNKLYLLKTDKSIDFICQAEDVSEQFMDILDDWVLSYDYNYHKAFKTNLKTKERIQIADFGKEVYVDNLYFLNSADTLIGQHIINNKDKLSLQFNNIENENNTIFTFNNNEFKTIKKGFLLGTIKNGYIYKVYENEPKEDNHIEHKKGWIYAKKIEEN